MRKTAACPSGGLRGPVKPFNKQKPAIDPAEFPVGSPESRAAARALLTGECVMECKVNFMGVSGCSVLYKHYRSGFTEVTGRAPTEEDFKNHPALQSRGNVSIPESEPEQKQEQDREVENESPRRERDEEKFIDPLAAVHQPRTKPRFRITSGGIGTVKYPRCVYEIAASRVGLTFLMIFPIGISPAAGAKVQTSLKSAGASYGLSS